MLPRPLNTLPGFAATVAVQVAAFYVELGIFSFVVILLVMLFLNTSTSDDRERARAADRSAELCKYGRQGRRHMARTAAKRGDPPPEPLPEVSAYSVFNRGGQRLAGEFDYEAYEASLRRGGMS
ncbi:hypothetical protein H9P43_009891 [Blastocladiella emersonii ATCC 22665]|nr:hypothetical protein H9P43_009891 [Blastocladiella emersonii ATCC 22665]